MPLSALLLVRIGTRVEDWPPTSPMTGLETFASTASGSPEFTVAVFGRWDAGASCRVQGMEAQAAAERLTSQVNLMHNMFRM